jgi:hypothetical protein
MLEILKVNNIKYYRALVIVMIALPLISPAMSQKTPICDACSDKFIKGLPACLELHKCNKKAPEERLGCRDGCISQEQSQLHQCFLQNSCPANDYPRLDYQAIAKDLANQAMWGLMLSPKGK